MMSLESKEFFQFVGTTSTMGKIYFLLTAIRALSRFAFEFLFLMNCRLLVDEFENVNLFMITIP